MKPTVLFSIAFLLFALQATGQTPVDRLTDELQSQSSGTINGWKYATAVTVDPRRSDFDDRSWTPLSLNEFLRVDSCWIRKVITLPATQLGIPLRGRVRFLLSIDDYGYEYNAPLCAIVSAIMSNFLEERGAALPAQGRKLIVPTRRHGATTIIVGL